jgi:hypothetical protein
MQRFEYKGCRVEIFATKKGARWTWAFVVNGTKAKANRRESCESLNEATRVAIAHACHFIDVET